MSKNQSRVGYGRKALLAAFALTMATGSVWAADATDENVYDLGEIIVTASRLQEKKIDVPADTTVITAAQIEKGNYSNVSDALKANNIPVIQKGFAAIRNSMVTLVCSSW